MESEISNNFHENQRTKLHIGSKQRNGVNRKSIRKCIHNNFLLIFTLIGVVFGGVLGITLHYFTISPVLRQLISYPGELFLRLLLLLILPLIVSSTVTGCANLNARLSGKIAFRTFIYFVLTSLLNAILGIVVAIAIHPGDAGLEKRQRNTIESSRSHGKTVSILDSILDLGRNLIPDNIFQATIQQVHTEYVNISAIIFNETTGSYELKFFTQPTVQYRNGSNNLGLVVFCVTFGTILASIGPRARPLIDILSLIYEVIMRLFTVLIWATPVGVASIITAKLLEVENLRLVLSQMAWLIMTVIVGIAIYQFIIIQLIYFAFVRKNPFSFYKSLAQGTLTAFSTASSAPSLPINLKILENDMKIDQRITRFVLSIGCNINLDGTALFLAVCTVFFAQMNRIELDFSELIIVCSTAASFASCSVPSYALLLISMVMETVNIPTNNVLLLFAIDWLLDRFRTTNNMLGDCYAAAVVERLSKKELIMFDGIEESQILHLTETCVDSN